MGLYVPTRYGGQAFATGYARVFETLGQVDGSLTVALGVHQSIGMKGIVLFGTDEQNERFLPDLAAVASSPVRDLPGPLRAPTPTTSARGRFGSRTLVDAEREKRWIGNGGRGSCWWTFAAARSAAPIVTRRSSSIAGMDGFESGERYDTMASRQRFAPLYFKYVRIPPENVLGEPGDGSGSRCEILNNGRMSLGTGSVGCKTAC